MRNTQQLNINNTFRSVNFNLFNPEEKHRLYLSRTSNKKMKKIINDKELDNYEFIIDFHSVKHSKFFQEVFNSKAKIFYPVDSVFPISLLFELGNRRGFEVVYPYREQYSTAELTNMDAVAKVFNIGVYVKVDPKVYIGNYLFGLNDLRYTLAYRVYFDFTMSTAGSQDTYYYNSYYNIYDKTPEAKIDDFSVIHECLARWRIQCYIGCLDEESYKKLKTLVEAVK